MYNEKNPLSEKALELLEDNGYKVKLKGGNITIVNSGCVRTGILLISIVPIIFSLFVIALSPLVGIPVFIIIIFLTIQQYGNNPGKSKISIDTKKRFIWCDDLYKYQLSSIKSIKMYSELADQYANAHKKSNEEHHFHITVKIDVFPYSKTLITLKSDYAQPSDEIREIYNWLKEVMRLGYIKR